MDEIWSIEFQFDPHGLFGHSRIWTLELLTTGLFARLERTQFEGIPEDAFSFAEREGDKLSEYIKVRSTLLLIAEDVKFEFRFVKPTRVNGKWEKSKWLRTKLPSLPK